MIKLFENFMIVTIIMILIFPTMLSVNGDQPVIASRISEIIYITVISDPDYYKPNNTFFGIEVEVEILNRDKENQSVIALADLFPKAFINASFVNQSLEIDQIAHAHETGMHYSYQPGITIEYALIRFYINQTDLSHLPDGNYTLWRPIDMGSNFYDITPGEQLITVITIASGIMNITYSLFDITEQPTDDITEQPTDDITEQPTDDITEQPTDEVKFSPIFSLALISLFSYVVIVFFRRKR